MFETEQFNGINELLEILGSIVNGFAIPLKAEHKQFLVRVLIPLHKPRQLIQYFSPLSYCVIQFLEKDTSLAEPIVKGLIKFWPKSCSQKEILFLTEVEELIEVMDEQEFKHIADPLFRQIAKCVSSIHFQVAERALFYWNNEYVASLIQENIKTIMPIIFSPLYRISTEHWNPTIATLVYNVLKTFKDTNPKLFDELSSRYKVDQTNLKRKEKEREELWKNLDRIQTAKTAKKK